MANADLTGMWIALGVGAAILLMYYLPGAFRSYGQQGEAKRRAFINRRLAAGVSLEDVLGECQMREHLAQIREIVSNHVRHNGPHNWEEVMKEHIRISVQILSSHDRRLGKQFLDWMMTLEHSDILYPHEHGIVYPPRKVEPVPDHIREHVTRITHAAYTEV